MQDFKSFCQSNEVRTAYSYFELSVACFCIPLLAQWASLVVQMVKGLPTMRRPGFDPWVGKILWRRKWQPTPVFLPRKSHGLRSLVDYSPWGRKESDTTEWLHLAQWARRWSWSNPHTYLPSAPSTPAQGVVVAIYTSQTPRLSATKPRVLDSQFWSQQLGELLGFIQSSRPSWDG